jgi:hypothetical protein
MTLIPPYDHAACDGRAGHGRAGADRGGGPSGRAAGLRGRRRPGLGLRGGGQAPRCPASPWWGVEPEAGNDTQQSLARRPHRAHRHPKTIADGAQTQASGALTFPVIQALVARVVTVSDAQLIRSMQFFAQRMKQVVEPTGCLAAAALLEGVETWRGARSASSCPAAMSTCRAMPNSWPPRPEEPSDVRHRQDQRRQPATATTPPSACASAPSACWPAPPSPKTTTWCWPTAAPWPTR